MSDPMAAGLGSGTAPRAREHADDEKTTLAQAERWATLLGAQLSAIVPKTLAPEPTSAWHPGAGDMTPAGTNGLTAPSAANGLCADASERAEPNDNRLIVRVDGGDLGEVALLVDRKDGAIRVTISAADAGAEAALGLEREGLMLALQGHGITVDSVNVVRANKFGTVLAPSRSTAAQPKAEAESESPDDDPVRRRSARKLNLIG